MASWRNVVFIVWKQAPTPALINALSGTILRIAQGRPRSVAVFVEVQSGMQLPDDASRKALASALLAIDGFLALLALLNVSTGFGGAAIRGAVTSVMLL